MSNYEIMLILNPTSDEKIVHEIAKSTFSSKEVKIEKMERTELAYEINKSKIATYILVNVKASGAEINEFSRKANITKNIWRILSLNLDTEKGLNRKAKPKRIKRNSSLLNKKSNENQTQQDKEKKEVEKVETQSLDKSEKQEATKNPTSKTKVTKKQKQLQKMNKLWI